MFLHDKKFLPQGPDGWNNPYRVGSAQVTVRVLDLNDNPPEFGGVAEGLSARVQEGGGVGEVLVEAGAVDPDEVSGLRRW